MRLRGRKQVPSWSGSNWELLAGNAHTLHVYEKFGFVREGVKRRKYYRDGTPIDMVMMALLLDK